MTVTPYFGLESCCDCDRTGNYIVRKNGYQFTVCSTCLQSYFDDDDDDDEEEEKMLSCKEPDGTVQRTVAVTIKPTATEIADAIWNLDSDEQTVLLGCLKRRFCNTEAGLKQIASVANTLDRIPKEKSIEAQAFVKCLADYILGE